MSMRHVGCWLVLSLVITVSGCSKHASDAPTPLPVNEMQTVFQRAFASAGADTEAAANQFVTDMQNHNATAAFGEIQDLRARPDLTADQQTTLARAMMTAAQELQKGADSGDQQSAQAMRQYKINH